MTLTRRSTLAGTMLLAMPGLACAQSLQKVLIAVSSASLPGGVARIARQMGLFEKNGLEARVIVMDSAAIASSALMSGSVDFSTAPGDEVVIAHTRGQPEIALLNVYSGFSGVVVLSKTVVEKLQISPTAPVKDRFKALDGLLIASPAATSSSTLAVKPAVEATGARVRFTYMAQSAMVSALESGAIQGFIASSPFYGIPVISGSGVIWINGPRGEFPPEYLPTDQSGLNAMRAFAEKNPEIVARVIATFEDFVRAVKERPAEVKTAIARLFPDLNAATLDLLFESESRSFSARPMTVEDMSRVIAYVKSSGVRILNLDDVRAADMVLSPPAR